LSIVGAFWLEELFSRGCKLGLSLARHLHYVQRMKSGFVRAAMWVAVFVVPGGVLLAAAGAHVASHWSATAGYCGGHVHFDD
jgi:hypothetical protein